MIDMRVLIILITTLGCALMAGVFFAFSISVMNGLSRLPAAGGIAAMQATNVAILNPIFLIVFSGTATFCAACVVMAIATWSVAGSPALLVGSLLYLIGSLLVTAMFNIPRNNALAIVDPASAAGDAVWKDYLKLWTMWNHVRGVAALAATATLIFAFRSA